MGLSIIFCIVITITLNIEDIKYQTLHEKLSAYVNNFIFGLIIGLLTTVIMTGVAVWIMHSLDCEFTLINTQKVELQEIEPNIYVISTSKNDSDKIRVTVKVNNTLKNINITRNRIILNQNEQLLEINEYDFISPIIRWLLFNPRQIKYTIYTQQQSLDGIFYNKS